MSLTLAWAWRNRVVQADQLVDHDDATLMPEEGQQVVVEWRYRAAPGDPWGDPHIDVAAYPRSTSVYLPAASGWVQITCYCTRDGLTSWQAHVGVVQVVGGGLYTPGNRITDADNRRITDAGDVRVTE